MALQAKTRLEDGVRIDIATGLPSFQNTERQQAALDASPQFNPRGTITAESLAPQTSIIIPPSPTPSQANGLLGMFEAGANSFLQTQQQKAEAASKDSSTAFEALLNAELSQTGEVAATDKAYSKSVDPLEKELGDINQQLFAEQHGLRRQIERIQQNSEGLETSGVQGRIDEVTRASLTKQADLAVIQLAKQGQYDSAKKIADRAVSALLEHERQRLDTLKFMYTENKDQFNKEEQRAFEIAQGERNRALDDEEYRLRAEFDNQIKQADPLYQLQIQKTRKEISLLGEPTPKEKKETEAALKEAQAALPVMRDKITAVDILKDHAGLNSRVGPGVFSRGFFAAGDRFGPGQEFAGGVHKLVSGMTIDNLIAAKARGATFGALSDGELQVLAASATAISDWELKKDGVGTGAWDIDEASFKRELDNIKTLTERAILLSGGSLMSDDETTLLDQLYEETAPFNPAAYYGF